VAAWLSISAVAWTVLVNVAGFVMLLAWEGWHTTADGVPIYMYVSFLGVRGTLGMSLIAIPLVITVAAAAGLRRRHSHGSAAGTAAAWGGVVALAAIAVVDGGLGVLLLPGAVLLAVATALAPRLRPTPEVGGAGLSEP
jgi:hypothetical protein